MLKGSFGKRLEIECLTILGHFFPGLILTPSSALEIGTQFSAFQTLSAWPKFDLTAQNGSGVMLTCFFLLLFFSRIVGILELGRRLWREKNKTCIFKDLDGPISMKSSKLLYFRTVYTVIQKRIYFFCILGQFQAPKTTNSLL